MPRENDLVTITVKELVQLKVDSMRLNFLEAGGVDNWEWYGEALYAEGEPSVDEEEDAIRKRYGLEPKHEEDE